MHSFSTMTWLTMQQIDAARLQSASVRIVIAFIVRLLHSLVINFIY